MSGGSASRYGVAVANEDQLAISWDFFDPLLGPNWYNLGDGGAVLAGGFRELMVRNNEAWLTTEDRANLANTGLFYCGDILAAMTGVPTWVLVKSGVDASNDTGYTGVNPYEPSICGMWMRDDDDICALIHSARNTAPGGGGQTGAYVGSHGSVSFVLLPQVAGDSVYQYAPSYGTLRCVWGGAGNFYIAMGSNDAGWKGVLQEVGNGNPSYDWTPPSTTRLVTAHNGRCQTWNVIGGFSVWGDGVWDESISEGALIQARAGMTFVTDYQGGGLLPYLYSKHNNNYDLWIWDGVAETLIGDASAEFGGGGLYTGYAEFYPGDTQRIVWVLGDDAPFATTNIVLYTEDQGTNWVAKDGAGATSLQNALGGGANWTGWLNNQIDNVTVRVFPY